MIQTIRASYPGVVALRTITDLDKYETAVEKFACSGSRIELMTALVGLGVPADQIRAIAAYPGEWLMAMCAE